MVADGSDVVLVWTLVAAPVAADATDVEVDVDAVFELLLHAAVKMMVATTEPVATRPRTERACVARSPGVLAAVGGAG